MHTLGTRTIVASAALHSSSPPTLISSLLRCARVCAGIAPESMRSFLRIDDLTFDLLSPLGTGRPGEKTENAFAPPTSEM